MDKRVTAKYNTPMKLMIEGNQETCITIMELLANISNMGDIGHSFEIQYNGDGVKNIGSWDGDGVCRIKNITFLNEDGSKNDKLKSFKEFKNKKKSSVDIVSELNEINSLVSSVSPVLARRITKEIQDNIFIKINNDLLDDYQKSSFKIMRLMELNELDDCKEGGKACKLMNDAYEALYDWILYYRKNMFRD